MTHWLPASAIGVVLALGACTPAAAPTPASQATPASSGLEAASSGLCHALAALPDALAAARAFTNEAHAPLHRLAADPRLSRPMAARVLEAMQLVEADLARLPDSNTLRDHLAALRAATDDALATLRVDIPRCAG
jgi:hypothetical protein